MAIDSGSAVIAAETSAAPFAAAGQLQVPAIVRRNSRLLLTAEAFLGTGEQMVPTLGAMMILHLTGSGALAGIGGSALGFTRVLASFPSGRLADAYGRRVVLIIALLLSLLGAVGLGESTTLGSFPLFLGSLLLFGIGNGASQQQRRLAAADMYPRELRARGLGFVLTGSMIGALGGPLLIGAAGAISGASGIDQISMSWFLVPFILLPSLGLILFVRPDPITIATALESYYPGYQRPESDGISDRLASGVSLWTFLRSYPQVVALVCMFVLYANMSMMMALAPMTMTAEGMALTAISVTVAIHVVGMYAFSLPLGRLADTIGRRRVLFIGLAISTGGTLLAALTASYPLIVLGLLLIGAGWSAGNVSTAALVADTTPPQLRGRAMGANSTFSAAGSVLAPLIGGVLLQRLGAPSLVAVTLIIVVPTVVLLAGLRETAPGTYDHASAW